MLGREIKSDNEFDKLGCMKAYSAGAKGYCEIFEKYILFKKSLLMSICIKKRYLII